jgi:hypothetical protein
MENGQEAKIGAPVVAKPGEPVTLTLPSGETVKIRQGFGRDLMNAQRAVQGSGDATSVVFALIAELAEFDGGRKIVYEDVLELPLADVLAMQAEVTKGNFPAIAPRSADRTS